MPTCPAPGIKYEEQGSYRWGLAQSRFAGTTDLCSASVDNQLVAKACNVLCLYPHGLISNSAGTKAGRLVSQPVIDKWPDPVPHPSVQDCCLRCMEISGHQAQRPLHIQLQLTGSSGPFHSPWLMQRSRCTFVLESHRYKQSFPEGSAESFT